MMTQVQGFIGGAYKLPSKNIAAQRCVNLYVENIPANDKVPAALIGSPGFSGFSSFVYDRNPIRQNGIFVTSTGLLIVALKNTLRAYTSIRSGDIVSWKPSGNGSFATLTFSHEPGYGPICMADNGIILFVSSGNAVYYYLLSEIAAGGSITTGIISGWPYGGFTHIQYLAGRFVVNTPNYAADDPTQNKFRVSPIDWAGNYLVWDDLAFASADQSPDPLLGFIVRGADLLLFSSQSTEFYYASDANPMPLIANTSVTSSIGCGAKYSIAKVEDSVFWLGAGADGFNKIFKCSGFAPERISTIAIEQEIANYGGTDDAIGMAYQKNGHSFYIISFQNGNATWQYDLTTGLWSELSSTNTAGNQERCRYVGMAAFQGEILALDRVSNGPVLLSNSTYTEAGSAILRVRTSPHIYSNLNRVFFNRFQLDMETGVGLTSGQGSDPLMRLRWSNDGGHKWSDFILRSFGQIGDYLKRVIWNSLGSSRNRIWEISTSEPVPIRILGAWEDVVEGES